MIALGMTGAALTVAIQTPPDQAASNLSAWLEVLGINRIPPFLLRPEADTIGTIVGVLAMFSAILWWWRDWRRKPTHHPDDTFSDHSEWLPLHQAFRYLVYRSRWGEKQPAAKDDRDFDRIVGTEVRERLARGEVEARGKRGIDTAALQRATEPIPADFWVNAFLQPHGEIALADDERSLAATSGGGPAYRCVILRKLDVEAVWPERAGKELTPLARCVERVRAKVATEQARSTSTLPSAKAILTALDEGQKEQEENARLVLASLLPPHKAQRLFSEVASKPPTLAVGLGPDNTPNLKTIWLEINNTGDVDAKGLVARLVDAKPPLFESRQDAIGLPLVLTTKARFDRHRTKLELLPQRPFNVASGDKKLLPVFRAKRFNPDIATIISEAGEIQVIFQEGDLTVEVTGGGCKPFRSIISIERGPSGSWTYGVTVEAVARMEGKGSFRHKEQPVRPPFPPPSSVKREVSLAEALGWVVYGEWEKPWRGLPATAAFAAGLGIGPNIYELLAEVGKRAGEGNLTMWGKLSSAGVWKIIPPGHWQDHELTLGDMFGGITSGEGGYHDLMLNRGEVEREWPHEG